MQPTIIRTKDSSEFQAKAVDVLRSIIMQATSERGRCVIGLSGGSTPRPIYTTLGADTSIDWSKVTICLIDERYVTADHADSNTRLVRDTLLTSARIPASQQIFPDTKLPLAECIADYDRRIAPLTLDLAILGMGDDGHTASLFPPLEPEAFGPHAVIHTTTDRFAVHDRISLTLPALKAASKRLFLIIGKAKSGLLSQMLSESEDPSMYPAQHLTDERTTWVVG